ncbi:hypothetical protein RRF57_002399 [Xylaria bambusicola]|uniref:Uncharacterized protein n=1 Tax=Xylaria bambusicola TaxID=326684 RepID=A0AAN7UIX9_9PEZI
MLLLIHALGGLAVPDLLFDATCRPQRRWQDDGNCREITAPEFGLSKRLIDLLSNEKHRRQIINELQVTEKQLPDGTITWSINHNLYHVLSDSLSDKTKQMWEIIALRLICFTCSPCYGDAPQWYVFHSSGRLQER